MAEKVPEVVGGATFHPHRQLTEEERQDPEASQVKERVDPEAILEATTEVWEMHPRRLLTMGMWVEEEGTRVIIMEEVGRMEGTAGRVVPEEEDQWEGTTDLVVMKADPEVCPEEMVGYYRRLRRRHQLMVVIRLRRLPITGMRVKDRGEETTDLMVSQKRMEGDLEDMYRRRLRRRQSVVVIHPRRLPTTGMGTEYRGEETTDLVASQERMEGDLEVCPEVVVGHYRHLLPRHHRRLLVQETQEGPEVKLEAHTAKETEEMVEERRVIVVIMEGLHRCLQTVPRRLKYSQALFQLRPRLLFPRHHPLSQTCPQLSRKSLFCR